MATSIASGSQTATLTTEHTLHTNTDAGTYVLYVDAENLAAGETLELKIYTKVQSVGTTRIVFSGVYKGENLIEPVIASVPVASINEYKATLEQNGGTGRAYPWEVVSL